jgi:hypothetical protein
MYFDTMKNVAPTAVTLNFIRNADLCTSYKDETEFINSKWGMDSQNLLNIIGFSETFSSGPFLPQQDLIDLFYIPSENRLV